MPDINVNKRIINYAQINKIDQDEARKTLEKEEERNEEDNSPRILTYDADDEVIAEQEYKAMIEKLRVQGKIETINVQDANGNDAGIVLTINKSQSGAKYTYTYDSTTKTLNINANKCVVQIGKDDSTDNLNDINIVLSGINVKLNSDVHVNSITSSAINCIINGSAEDDNIIATGLNTTINGRNGNDTINSSGSNSTIRGGSGDDEITSTGMNTNIFAGAGDDNIFARGVNMYVDAGTGEGNVNVYGNDIAVDAGTTGNKVISGEGRNIVVMSGNAANHIELSGVGSDVQYEKEDTTLLNPNDYISKTDVSANKTDEHEADRTYDATTGLNAAGYDKNGYTTVDGQKVNFNGYNENGLKDGYNALGYNAQGYDKDGYDVYGYNSQGLDRNGYNKEGYNPDKIGTEEYYKDGYNKYGYDKNGYDKNGYNTQGIDKEGNKKENIYSIGKDGKLYYNGTLYSGPYTGTDKIERLYKNGEVDTEKQVYAGNGKLYNNGVVDKERQVYNHELYDGGVKQETNKDYIINTLLGGTNATITGEEFDESNRLISFRSKYDYLLTEEEIDDYLDYSVKYNSSGSVSVSRTEKNSEENWVRTAEFASDYATSLRLLSETDEYEYFEQGQYDYSSKYEIEYNYNSDNNLNRGAEISYMEFDKNTGEITYSYLINDVNEGTFPRVQFGPDTIVFLAGTEISELNKDENGIYTDADGNVRAITIQNEQAATIDVNGNVRITSADGTTVVYNKNGVLQTDEPVNEFTKGDDGRIYHNGELYSGLYTDTTVDNVERLYKNGEVDTTKQVFENKLYNNGEVDTTKQVFENKLYNNGVVDTTRQVFENKLYNNGEVDTTKQDFNGTLYINGTKSTNDFDEFNNCLYLNGVKSTNAEDETITKHLYRNGNLVTDEYALSSTGKLYEKGTLSVGLKQYSVNNLWYYNGEVAYGEIGDKYYEAGSYVADVHTFSSSSNNKTIQINGQDVRITTSYDEDVTGISKIYVYKESGKIDVYNDTAKNMSFTTDADLTINVVENKNDQFVLGGGNGNNNITVKEGVSLYQVFGRSGNDTITIEEGVNIYHEVGGGAGNDIIINNGIVYHNIYSGEGNDNIINNGTVNGDIGGGIGDDLITNNGTAKIIEGGTGNDTITNNGTVSTWLRGGEGDDTITNSGTATSFLLGDEGDDTIINSGTAKNVSGGAGDDEIINTENGNITGSVKGDEGDDIFVNEGTVKTIDSSVETVITKSQDGKYYVGEEPYTGLILGVLYEEGSRSTGLVQYSGNNLWYYNGEIANGKIGDNTYVQGVLQTDEPDEPVVENNKTALLSMLGLAENTEIDENPAVNSDKQITAFSITNNGQKTQYNVIYDTTGATVIKITDPEGTKSTRAFDNEGSPLSDTIDGRRYQNGSPYTSDNYASIYPSYKDGYLYIDNTRYYAEEYYLEKFLGISGVSVEDISGLKTNDTPSNLSFKIDTKDYDFVCYRDNTDKITDKITEYISDNKYITSTYNDTSHVLTSKIDYDDTRDPARINTSYNATTGKKEDEVAYASYGLKVYHKTYEADGETEKTKLEVNKDYYNQLQYLYSVGYDVENLLISYNIMVDGQSMSFDLPNLKLTDYISSDIEIYRNADTAATQAKNDALAGGATQAQAQQAYTVSFGSSVSNALVPVKTSTTAAYSSTTIGDIVEVGNKLYVNDGTQMVELKMTKGQFLDLFPVIDRYATKQGSLGDCYLISGILIGALENKTAFSKLIQMFEYDNDGNLTITFDGMPDYPVTFNGGKLYNMDGIYGSVTDGPTDQTSGCDGVKFLEQAYAIACFQREQNAEIDTIDIDQAIDYIQNGWNSIAQNNVFGGVNAEYKYFFEDTTANKNALNKVNAGHLLEFLNAREAISAAEGDLLTQMYTDPYIIEGLRDLTYYYEQEDANKNIWQLGLSDIKSILTEALNAKFGAVGNLDGISDTTLSVAANLLKNIPNYHTLAYNYEVAYGVIDKELPATANDKVWYSMVNPNNLEQYKNNLSTMSVYEAVKADQNILLSTLENYAQDGVIMLGAGTVNDDSADNPQYYIVSGHAYCIESVDKENRTVNVINPWTGALSVTVPLDDMSTLFEGIFVEDLSKINNGGNGGGSDADAAKAASKDALFSTWTLGNAYKDTATDFAYDTNNNLTSFKVNGQTYEVLYDSGKQMAVVTQENETTSGVYNLTENNINSELEKEENSSLLSANVNIYPDNFGSYINYDSYQEYTVTDGKLIDKNSNINNIATESERTQCLNILEKLNADKLGYGFDISQLIISNVKYSDGKITGFDITNTDNTFVDDLAKGNEVYPSADATIIKNATISDITYSGTDITQLSVKWELFSNMGETYPASAKLYYSQGKLIKEEYEYFTEDLVFRSMIEYEYENDKVVKEVTTSTNSSGEIYITYYDGTDNIRTETSSSSFQYDLDGQTINYTLTDTTTYTYDSQNRVVTETLTQSTNISGADIPPEYAAFLSRTSTTTTTYSYDTATGLVSKITSVSDSNEYDNYETTYEYYTEPEFAGLLKKETTTSAYDYLNKEVSYEYAINGKILKEQEMYSNNVYSNTEIQYIYNSNGDLARKIELDYNAIMARDLAKYQYNIDNDIDVVNSQAKINEILSNVIRFKNYGTITSVNDIISLPDEYKELYLQNLDKISDYQEVTSKAINDFLTLYNKFINENKNSIYIGNSNAMNRQQVAHILSNFFGTENEKIWYGDNLIKIMKNPDLPADLRQAAANLLNLNEQCGNLKEFVEISNKVNDTVALVYFQTTEELKLQNTNARIQELEGKTSLTTEEKQLLAQYKLDAQRYKNNIEALRYGDFLQYMYNEGLLEKPDTSIPSSWEVSSLIREATYIDVVNQGTITANTTDITVQDKSLVSASFIKDTSVPQAISSSLSASAVEALFQSDIVSNGTLNDSFFLSVYREMTPEQRENLISVDITNGTITVNLAGAMNYQIATSRTYKISDLEQITQVAMTYDVNGENKTVIKTLCPDNIFARAVEMAIIDNHGADIFDTDYYYGDVYTYLTTISTVEKRGDNAEWERAVAFIKDDITYTIKDMDNHGNISYYNPDSPEEIIYGEVQELSIYSIRVIQTVDRNGKYDLSNLDWDPIILDINNREEVTTDIIDYDIDGDGTPDKINNVTDFVLTFDKNKNGVYGEDGTELFGTATDLNNDGIIDGYANGFEALKALAEKYHLISADDRVLDSNDIAFLENIVGLRMKQGYLGDAYKFSELGITAIYIPDTNDVQYQTDFDGNGNDIMTQTGATFIINGEVRTYADIWHKKQ